MKKRKQRKKKMENRMEDSLQIIVLGNNKKEKNLLYFLYGFRNYFSPESLLKKIKSLLENAKNDEKER